MPNSYDIEFLGFVVQKQRDIFQIQRNLGFRGEYRTRHSFIRYDRHLTPPLNLLKEIPNLFAIIGSNATFSLKKAEKIPADYLSMYQAAFDFDPDNSKTFGNSVDDYNIFRCLYDLSFRYQGDDLLNRCKAFIIAYAKYFQLKFKDDFNFIDFLKFIIMFFHVHNDQEKCIDFLRAIHTEFNAIQPNDTLFALELDVFYEFAYICPDPTSIKDLMKAYFIELFVRLNNPEIDIVDTAAWIIKTIGDIHPFDDGNGRVARALALNLIGSKKNIAFTQDEIESFSKDKDFIAATSKINSMEKIKLWLTAAILNKKPVIESKLAVRINPQ